MNARGAGLAAMLMLVAGCSSDTNAIDHHDPRPLLTYGSYAYGMADYFPPLDEQTIYVYPDGTMIHIDIAGPVMTKPQPLRATTFHIDDAELERLLRFADATGLDGTGPGGMEPQVSLPAGAQVMDGGYALFTRRSGDKVTARFVDQLGASPEYDSGTPRAAFAALSTALWHHITSDTPTGHLPLTHWAIVARDGQAKAPQQGEAWTGPTLSSLAWTDISTADHPHTRCSIFTRANWPIGPGEEGSSQLVVDGAVVTRRPLLPHEHTCTDVAATRSLLHL
jgi:hypothetical protein